MRAEVLAVGTELLLGDIINTNAAEIGQMLAHIGVDCMRATVVGDNIERIADGMREALGRSDAVIVTGGLGPTQDDVTREAIAMVTSRALIRDEAIVQQLRERFARYGREMPEMNLRQADVPAGATIIPLAWGTAPGLIVTHGDGVIYAVPGVPREMRDMLGRAVLPDLRRRAGGSTIIRSRSVRIGGVSESAVAATLDETWRSMTDGATIAFLAGSGDVRVRITAKAADDAAVVAVLDRAEAEIRALFGSQVIGIDDQTSEQVVADLLRARGWTIGVAESLTGGGVSVRLSALPGSSETFRGALIPYATRVKTSPLGVAADLIDREGPVSAAVAIAMAYQVRELLGCEVGLAVTGVAGPTEQGRSVGTVFVSAVTPEGEATRHVTLPGDRETIRTLAAGAALNLARLTLMGEF